MMKKYEIISIRPIYVKPPRSNRIRGHVIDDVNKSDGSFIELYKIPVHFDICDIQAIIFVDC